MVGKRDFKLCISEPEMVRGSPSGRYHFRNRVDPNDLAFGSDQASHAQGRLSGTRSDIQDRVLTADLPIFYKSFGDWRKHLPDDFAVLLPERCGTGPAVHDLVVGLHEEKYNRPGVC